MFKQSEMKFERIFSLQVILIELNRNTSTTRVKIKNMKKRDQKMKELEENKIKKSVIRHVITNRRQFLKIW